MPAGISKLNRKPKILRKLDQKFAKNLSSVFWGKRWRQLNQHDLQLRFEGLDGSEKAGELGRAVAQLANMGDLAGQFAAETK